MCSLSSFIPMHRKQKSWFPISADAWKKANKNEIQANLPMHESQKPAKMKQKLGILEDEFTVFMECLTNLLNGKRKAVLGLTS